jgi:predicted transport protein
LITQSLFYLHWIQDHRGDFQIAVQKTLRATINIDWSDIRVICIAPNFKKYDLHAVKVMGANIELWTYRRYKNGAFHLEEVFHKSVTSHALDETKNPVMVAAGKKAAQTRAKGQYTFEQHVKDKPTKIRELAQAIQEYIMGLDSAMEEVPKKMYVAYRISQNIVCLEVQKKKVNIYLKLSSSDISKPAPKGYKNVTELGHYGTGDTEFAVSSLADLEAIKPYIELSYQKVGG